MGRAAEILHPLPMVDLSEAEKLDMGNMVFSFH